MTRQEIQDRLARLRTRLAHSNGEYALELEQDIKSFEAAQASHDGTCMYWDDQSAGVCDCGLRDGTVSK